MRRRLLTMVCAFALITSSAAAQTYFGGKTLACWPARAESIADARSAYRFTFDGDGGVVEDAAWRDTTCNNFTRGGEFRLETPGSYSYECEYVRGWRQGRVDRAEGVKVISIEGRTLRIEDTRDVTRIENGSSRSMKIFFEVTIECDEDGCVGHYYSIMEGGPKSVGLDLNCAFLQAKV